jgi:hypothetical protein
MRQTLIMKKRYSPTFPECSWATFALTVGFPPNGMYFAIQYCNASQIADSEDCRIQDSLGSPTDERSLGIKCCEMGPAACDHVRELTGVMAVLRTWNPEQERRNGFTHKAAVYSSRAVADLRHLSRLILSVNNESHRADRVFESVRHTHKQILHHSLRTDVMEKL